MMSNFEVSVPDESKMLDFYVKFEGPADSEFLPFFLPSFFSKKCSASTPPPISNYLFPSSQHPTRAVSGRFM